MSWLDALLHDYLTARISIGEFAELMGMGYGQARSCLQGRGIATIRRFNDQELEAACEANYQALARAMNINLPQSELGR